MKYNIRAICANLLFRVLEQGQSLREQLPAAQASLTEKDKAWVQEVTYGVLRHLPLLQFWLRPMLSKPLKGKNKVIEHLLLVGLYQLNFTRVSAHAALSETVNACVTLKAPSLKGLVNAILRNAQRQTLPQPEDGAVQNGLPNWLYQHISQAYGERAADVFNAMQHKAPLWLRVNRARVTHQDFLQALTEQQLDFSLSEQHPDAVILNQFADITRLPGFAQGWFSVQDGAAQLAAAYLNPQAGERVLDACAAPGGKTGHIAELAPEISELIALDSEASRLERVKENLQRLGHQASIICADAGAIDSWWDGKPFDRILLDAPCSATGVIRRHPDIRWLRKAFDIPALVELQQQILNALWQTLKPGGHLLYATCSILPQENCQQIERFLQQHTDACLLPLPGSDAESVGRQILPGEQQMDGFYYAMLLKSE